MPYFFKKTYNPADRFYVKRKIIKPVVISGLNTSFRKKYLY